MNPLAAPTTTRSRAFTLIEMLVVVTIVALMVAMAIPVLSVLSGNTSLEMGQNKVAALLTAARADAIAMQRVAGVMFYRDSEGIIHGVVVRASDPQPVDVDVYLDLAPDFEAQQIPIGVSLQTVDNVEFSNGVRADDAYIGFNNLTNNASNPQLGGVILFDARGQLVSLRYGFRLGYGDKWSPMGRLLLPGDSGLPPSNIGKDLSLRSVFGLVLFNAEAFENQPGSTIDDPGASYGADERAEETWIDDNSIPLLVNRYNGTLIKGE